MRFIFAIGSILDTRRPEVSRPLITPNSGKIPLAHFLLLKSPAQQRILLDLEMVQPRSLASAVGGKDQLAKIGDSAHSLTNCSAVPVVNSPFFEGKPLKPRSGWQSIARGVSPWKRCEDRLALEGRQ